MAKIGQQIEHQRGVPAIVDDPEIFVAVAGDPIIEVETDLAAEREVLDLTTLWPYKNGRKQS